MEEGDEGRDREEGKEGREEGKRRKDGGGGEGWREIGKEGGKE